MKLMSKKEAYSKILCLKCGEPLLDAHDLAIWQKHPQILSNRKYHHDCQLDMNVYRTRNASSRRRHEEVLVCICCGKEMQASKIDKSGYCARCRAAVEKRDKYNTELKKHIDWEHEPKKQYVNKPRKPCIHTEFHSPYREFGMTSDLKSIENEIEHGYEYGGYGGRGKKSDKFYRNPASYKLDDPKYLESIKETAQITHKTVRDKDGNLMDVEIRGQGHCGGGGAADNAPWYSHFNT